VHRGIFAYKTKDACRLPTVRKGERERNRCGLLLHVMNMDMDMDMDMITETLLPAVDPPKQPS